MKTLARTLMFAAALCLGVVDPAGASGSPQPDPTRIHYCGEVTCLEWCLGLAIITGNPGTFLPCYQNS